MKFKRLLPNIYLKKDSLKVYFKLNDNYYELNLIRNKESFNISMNDNLIDITDKLLTVANCSIEELIDKYNKRNKVLRLTITNTDDVIEASKSSIRLLRFLYVYNSSGSLIERVNVHHKLKGWCERNDINYISLLGVLRGKKLLLGERYYSKVKLTFKYV